MRGQDYTPYPLKDHFSKFFQKNDNAISTAPTIMIGGRQNAANLWEGTRRSSTRSISENLGRNDQKGRNRSTSKLQNSSLDRARSFLETISLKKIRTGVTGKLYVSLRKEDVSDLNFIVEKDEILAGVGTGETNGSQNPILPPPIPVRQNGISKEYTYLEIERCDELSIPMKFSFCDFFRTNKHSNPPFFPFVLVRLNGREVGRTPPVSNLKRPFWMDECFRIPLSDRNSCLSFEVWGAVPKDRQLNSDHFLGRCSISLSSIGGGMEMKEYCIDLKRWRHIDAIEGESSTSTCVDSYQNQLSCPPLEGDSTSMANASFNPRETIRVRPSEFSLLGRKGRRKSIEIEKPNDDLDENDLTKYRVPNSFPFRRKDVENTREEKETESWLQSTLFKAIALVCLYLTIGVIGYSYIFEDWSIRNSLYFSIVTFTTVGYG